MKKTVMKSRYVRFTKLTFDSANYDAMIDYRDNTIVPKLNETRLQGLVRVRMIRVFENEVIILAAYDTKENYEASLLTTDQMMEDLSQWLNFSLERWAGELEDLYGA